MPLSPFLSLRRGLAILDVQGDKTCPSGGLSPARPERLSILCSCGWCGVCVDTSPSRSRMAVGQRPPALRLTAQPTLTAHGNASALLRAFRPSVCSAVPARSSCHVGEAGADRWGAWVGGSTVGHMATWRGPGASQSPPPPAGAPPSFAAPAHLAVHTHASLSSWGQIGLYTFREFGYEGWGRGR